MLLSELILNGPRDLSREDAAALARRWEQRWRREFGIRMRLGRWLQPLLLRGWTGNVAVELARRLPVLPRWIAHATRGT
jgi:hypothetical protein